MFTSSAGGLLVEEQSLLTQPRDGRQARKRSRTLYPPSQPEPALEPEPAPGPEPGTPGPEPALGLEPATPGPEPAPGLEPATPRLEPFPGPEPALETEPAQGSKPAPGPNQGRFSAPRKLLDLSESDDEVSFLYSPIPLSKSSSGFVSSQHEDNLSIALNSSTDEQRLVPTKESEILTMPRLRRRESNQVFRTTGIIILNINKITGF